jgi:bacillithiol system protein YtxJ
MEGVSTIPSCGLIIFKFSPVCPISRGVERDFDAWYAEIAEATELLCVKVNVRGSNELSQHIAQEFGIQHESPQAIWLTPERSVLWHASHRSIRPNVLNEHLSNLQ